MTQEEFETLLQGAREAPSLDFKQGCAWNSRTFIKDMLAMSNLEDGGRIIVGVVDGTWERGGVSDADVTSYAYETMRDQVARYADPGIDFEVDIIVDAESKKYVVIRVLPFAEQPTICRADGPDVTEGVIYYRPSTGRVQSSPVKRAYELRKMLEVAAARMFTRFRNLGLAPAVPAEDATRLYDEELGDL